MDNAMEWQPRVLCGQTFCGNICRKKTTSLTSMPYSLIFCILFYASQWNFILSELHRCQEVVGATIFSAIRRKIDSEMHWKYLPLFQHQYPRVNIPCLFWWLFCACFWKANVFMPSLFVSGIKYVANGDRKDVKQIVLKLQCVEALMRCRVWVLHILLFLISTFTRKFYSENSLSGKNIKFVCQVSLSKLTV